MNVTSCHIMSLLECCPNRDRDGIGSHDDVIIWRCYSHYWPFVWGIHCSLVVTPHECSVMQSFDVYFCVCLDKLLNKHVICQWFEMPWQWMTTRKGNIIGSVNQNALEIWLSIGCASDDDFFVRGLGQSWDHFNVKRLGFQFKRPQYRYKIVFSSS